MTRPRNKKAEEIRNALQEQGAELLWEQPIKGFEGAMRVSLYVVCRGADRYDEIVLFLEMPGNDVELWTPIGEFGNLQYLLGYIKGEPT